MFEIALFTVLKNKFSSKSTPGSFWIKSPLVFANHASSSCPQKKGQVVFLDKQPDMLLFAWAHEFLFSHPTYIFHIEILGRANLSQNA